MAYTAICNARFGIVIPQEDKRATYGCIKTFKYYTFLYTQEQANDVVGNT